MFIKSTISEMISLLFASKTKNKLISTIFEEIEEEANSLDKDFLLSLFVNVMEG